MNNIVTINKKEYPVKFGVSVVKAFSLLKGFKTLNEFERWFEKANPNAISTIDDISELYLLAIQRGCKKENIECNLDKDDILDLMTEDQEQFNKLQEILIQSVGTDEAPTMQVADEPEPEKKVSAGRG